MGLLPVTLVAAVTCAASNSPQGIGSARAVDASSLLGVWEARTVMGPRLSGSLTFYRDGAEIKAEIAGYSAVCKQVGSRLEATFGNGLGEFKGRFVNGGIEGHWIQPQGTVLGLPFASPVKLDLRPGHVWVGEVKPLQDVATFFLVLRPTPEGKVSVFLRNPERNLGLFIQADELTSDTEGIHLKGTYLGSEDRVELARGSYDKSNEIISLYFPGRPMSFQFTKAATNEFSEFYPRPKGDRAYHYRPPVSLPDGWDVGDAGAAGISVPALERFIQMIIDQPDDSVHQLRVHGILLARNGKLVLDEYFHGYSANTPHDLRSAAKSLTSILAGVAMRESKTLSLRTRVLDVLGPTEQVKASDPRKAKITVENLLTMSAGLDCDDRNPNSPGNEDVMQSQSRDPDWYHFALNLPMAFEPGAQSVYGGALPNLLGGVIAADRNVWLPEYFRDRVAKPLDIDEYYVPLAPDGQAYMGGGVQLRPRDFLKLGQLMLDGGIWKGRRILEKSYVDMATQPHYELRGIRYGFLWWVIEYPFRGQTLQAFFAGGNGGQVVIVIPKLDLVFGCVAGNYSDSSTYIPQREFVPKYVLPMMLDGEKS